jgi:hypothetical protein
MYSILHNLTITRNARTDLPNNLYTSEDNESRGNLFFAAVQVRYRYFVALVQSEEDSIQEYRAEWFNSCQEEKKGGKARGVPK